MASLPQGVLRVLTWFDSVSDELKALINDDGEMPVNVGNFPVTVDTHIHSYDSGAWVKNPIIWGFTDSVSDYILHVKVGVGDYTMPLVTVPDGYVYVITAITAMNANSICNIQFLGYDLVHSVVIGAGPAQPLGVHYSVSGLKIPMTVGYSLRILFQSCANNDVLRGYFWGYKMKVDM